MPTRKRRGSKKPSGRKIHVSGKRPKHKKELPERHKKELPEIRARRWPPRSHPGKSEFVALHKRTVVSVLPGRAAGPTYRLVFVGDGFAETDRQLYVDTVDRLVDDLFSEGNFREDAAGFSVRRIDLWSRESGVSTQQYNGDIVRDTLVGGVIINEGLSIRIMFSNEAWDRLREILEQWTPDYDKAIVVLNDGRRGGVSYEWMVGMTRTHSANVLSHELGHAIGGLADEYAGDPGPYPGPEPVEANVTTNTDRATLKWGHYVRPETALPTTVVPPNWDSSQDVGLFAGGKYYSIDIYRPVRTCRMRFAGQAFCPVCYTELKEVMDAYLPREFTGCHIGRFGAEGRSGLVVRRGRELMRYSSTGAGMELTYVNRTALHADFDCDVDDLVVVGDFNGDGKDELAIHSKRSPYYSLALLVDDDNGGFAVQWTASMLGTGPWKLRRHDRLIAADYDGDGRQDLVSFNAQDWDRPHLGLWKSLGNAFDHEITYQRLVPGWEMTAADEVLCGDFDGDQADEILLFNASSGPQPRLAVYRAVNGALAQLKRYDGTIDTWQMRASDRIFFQDVDGDGRLDLCIFNGVDWPLPRLGILRSTGVEFVALQMYEGSIGAWPMRANDKFIALDAAGTGRMGFLAHNVADWPAPRISVLTSNGAGLTGNFVLAQVGTWQLGADDRFLPFNYGNDPAAAGVLAIAGNRLGLLRLAPVPLADRVYHKWIHDYHYGINPP